MYITLWSLYYIFIKSRPCNYPIFWISISFGRTRLRMVPNIMMVKRFPTLVMATRPTFWEKEVSGGHPNREDIAEEYPSHAREPWISSPVISRFRPPETMADVSPMVSAADTRKMLQAKRDCFSNRHPPIKTINATDRTIVVSFHR